MSGLSLLWLYVALPGLLRASHVSLMVEGENDASRICKPAPHWTIKGRAPMQELLGNVVVVALLKASWQFCLTQASKIGGLRDELNHSNLTDVSFMVVNEREARSRAMYWELKRRAPLGVPVYQQAPLQNDVWEALDGDKDDFLVYDRCGLLTFHIVLPFSFLHNVYVKAAIRATYLNNICNCTASALSRVNNSSMTNATTHFNVSQTTTIPDTSDPEGGGTAPIATRHHSHHHPPHHSHQQQQHHHYQNQSQHQHDASQNTTLHPLIHRHHPQQQHQHQQPGNHPGGMEVDN